MSISNTKSNAVQIPSRDKVVELFKQYFFNRTDRICLDLRPGFCVCPHDPRNQSELDELIAAHVFGDFVEVSKNNKWQEQDQTFPVTRIGSYSPNTDNNTKWVCIDIDGGKDHTFALKDPLAILHEIYTKCQDQEIPAYIEKSKSGNGYHLWIFFADFVEATVAKQFGYSLFPTELELLSGQTISAYVKKGLEIFPLSNKISEGGCGLPMLLPWNYKNDEGCTLFHEYGEDEQLDVIRSEIQEFQTIDVDAVNQIAESFTLPEIERKTDSVDSLNKKIKTDKDAFRSRTYHISPLIQTILQKVKIQDVYGDVLTGNNSGQWLGCRDLQSDSRDQNPSAGVADGTGRCTKGTFHTFLEGKTMSIFDYMVRNGDAYSYSNAVEILAEKTGVELKKGDLLIEQMNRRYFCTYIENEHVIVKEKPNNIGVNRPHKFLKVADFKSEFRNKFITYEKNGKTVCETWAEFCLKHPNRRAYDDFVFKPGGCEPNEYNSCNIFAVLPVKGKWDRYQDHIFHNVCQGNKEQFDYVMKWMAYCVQYPEKRPETALVLKGRMGTGKGIFAKYFGRLFGDHYEHLSNPYDLVGQFNSLIQNKLVVFLDEKVCTNDDQADSQLKVLVTEDKIQIQQKYKDKYTVDNYLKLIFASNMENVIQTDVDERRFFILKMGDRNIQDKEYFSKLIKQMENGGCEALLYDLLQYEIKGDLRSIPQTDELIQHKLNNIHVIGKFWYEHLDQGRLLSHDTEWQNELLTKDLFDLFKQEYPKESITPITFGKKIKEFCPQIDNQKSNRPIKDIEGHTQPVGSRIYRLPDLTECRELFDQKINSQLKWNNGFDEEAVFQTDEKSTGQNRLSETVSMEDDHDQWDDIIPSRVDSSSHDLIISNN